MLRRWSLREQNRGASLIAVLVAMIFVGILGMLIAQITITNIQLKEAERGSKSNFYSAETVMDDLTSGLNNKAAFALQEAYNVALAHYRNTLVQGVALQEEFTKVYLDSLQDIFAADDDSPSTKFVDGTTTPYYVVGRYNISVLENSFSCYDADYATNTGLTVDEVNALKDRMKSYLNVPANPAYHLDYGKGTFTLKDVAVRYTDDFGYESHIKTDIVFHTPEINFTGSNAIKDFMRYSLIADKKIQLEASNVTIDGNVYAGHEGIEAGLNSSTTFKGNIVITRGDVVAKNGSKLIMGEGNTKLWAENVVTTGDGSASDVQMNGNFYISDDLTMEGDTVDGQESILKLTGNYYGYNFQDKYLDVHKNTDAQYSSAIMINGKNSKLDLTNVNYLLLSGRTYISRGKTGSSNQDIMLGESLSVRTNQLAYYVPKPYLLIPEGGTATFKPGEGISDYSKYLGMDTYTMEIQNWVDPVKPVVAYRYPDGATTETGYYLNFKDEQSANDFFAAYVQENRNAIESYSEEYIGNTGLIINDSVILTLKGNIMYRAENILGGEQDEAIYDKHVVIEGGDWSQGGIYHSYANRLAMTYMSLQMYLEESREDITAADVRFAGNDKTITPLMSNLMDVTAFSTDLFGGIRTYEQDLGGGTKQVVVLTDNKNDTKYSIPNDYQEGIIIASGDVHVNNKFNGMIIAGGKITFATNASVTSDEMLVSQMFAKDLAGVYNSGIPLFAIYFKDYDTFSESVIGMIEIERFTTYEGWTKTEE